MKLARLAGRAAAVWRREGLGGLARRLRRRWTGWRPEGGLRAGLETPLPDSVAVGAGTLLLVSGWYDEPASRVVGLEVVANGTSNPATLIPGGFTAVLGFQPGEAGQAVDVELWARLRDGTRCTSRLGSVHLLAGTPAAPPSASAPPAPSARPPRVAICMATYNPPPALFERQLESIRQQTCEDWVCLISDDGSEPEAFERIRALAARDARFHVSRGPERAGFYRNFERCLTLVPPGVEYVALSDQDDRWHPDKLAALLSAFEPGTTLVYSDMNVIDAQGAVLSNTYWTTRPNRCDDLGSLLIANTVTGAASLFRASLLPHALPFPQPIAAPYHDHWIACVALATGRIGYVDRPLYDYVQHAANVLGHYAPAEATAWAEARGALARAARDPRRLGATLERWRAVYLGEVQRLKLTAGVLRARCGALLSPDKARVVDRLAQVGESWRTTLWLAARGLRRPGRVSETLGGERTLLRGLAWRRYAALAARLRPRAGAARRAAAPPAGGGDAADRIGQIERKIAPLRLRVSSGAPPRVNLLIPTIDFTYFFGGYIAKFNLARRLADEGRRVRIVAVDPCLDRMSQWRDQVRAFEGLEGVFDRVEVALAGDREQPLDVHPGDAFIATTWWTAHIAQRALQALGRSGFVYLIQEYEPFTFPMGSLAALARESYGFPHRAVFSTELLREYFRLNGIGVYAGGLEAGERDSVSFQNAITPVGPVSVADLAGRTPRRLLFYARPEAHASRNMFELAVLALSRAIAEGAFEGPWEFNGLGAVSEAGGLPLPGGARLRVQPRLTQAEYRELLRGHDIGLSLMDTPHPSLVPIEMASAGMLVVTNTFANKTAERLRAISPNILAVEPTIEAVAGGLREAAAAVGDHPRRAEGSRVIWSTHWDTSLGPPILRQVLNFLADCGS